eukprot:759717-Hanusia_phi.AAC.6
MRENHIGGDTEGGWGQRKKSAPQVDDPDPDDPTIRYVPYPIFNRSSHMTPPVLIHDSTPPRVSSCHQPHRGFTHHSTLPHLEH